MTLSGLVDDKKDALHLMHFLRLAVARRLLLSTLLGASTALACSSSDKVLAWEDDVPDADTSHDAGKDAPDDGANRDR